jgi:ribose transport system permease protein
MSSVALKDPRRTRELARTSAPFLILALMLVAFYVLPQLSGREATVFNVFNSMQNFAALGLVALALGLTMIAGEFDLSVVGMYGLGSMLAVMTGKDSALIGLGIALLAGLFVGLVQGTIIAKLRINSMPVTLGGYLLLLGLTATIGHDDSQSYPNLSVGSSLDSVVAQIFSLRSLVAVGVFVVVTLAMRYTRLGRDIRAIGGDRRASRTAGVPVDRMLIGVFALSSVLSALAGALIAYSLATATPDPGLAPLIFAITAVLLGGVTLAGGQGAALAIAAGAITLSLLQELFSILGTPTYVSSLITGGLLVLVTIIAAPDLKQWWRTVRTRRGGPTASAASVGSSPAATVTGER